METKYRFLRIAATVFKVIGWILLVVGVIGFIVLGTQMGTMLPEAGGIAALYVILGIIYSVLLWISLIAAAELCLLFIDLEQNTRETAERLRTGSSGS